MRFQCVSDRFWTPRIIRAAPYCHKLTSSCWGPLFCGTKLTKGFQVCACIWWWISGGWTVQFPGRCIMLSMDYWHISSRRSVSTFCSLTAHLYAVLRFQLSVAHKLGVRSALWYSLPIHLRYPWSSSWWHEALERLMSILGSGWVGEKVWINEVWCKITRFWNKRETEE
jgi:hypothetical protein